jgi:hypothetical protein
MIITATKKAILLLSIISLPGSMFGMLERAQKNISTLVISQKKQAATAVLVPLAAAGCYVLAQHKEDISSLFEKIPMPSEKVIFGLATAAAMPVTYVLAGKFSPEEQFQLYHRNNTNIQEHPIMQHKELLKQFLAGKQEIQFEGRALAWSDFIAENFSDEIEGGVWSSIKVGNELCALKRRMNVELQRLNRIKDAGLESSVVEEKDVKKEKVLHEEKSAVNPIVMVSQALDQLNKDISFIKQLLGKTVNSPEHKEDRKDCPAIKKNELTAEQITFSSKIAAFVPMFTQPVSALCMVFLGILLAKFGIAQQYE